jgi:hypothetical protein
MNANQVTNEKEFWAFMAKLSEERARQDQELNARFAKTDARISALAEQFTLQSAETEGALKALAEQFTLQSAETEGALKALAEQSNRTELQLAKTDAQLAKTDEKLNKLAKLFGDVNNNRGEEAEEFFFSSLKKHPQIGGMTFHTIHRNLSGDQDNIVDEFDLILANGNALALIEVKTKAHLSLVDKMIEKKIPNLRKLLPMFKDYKIYAGIASLVTYPELIKKTTDKGLFLLSQQGKHLEIVSSSLQYF